MKIKLPKAKVTVTMLDYYSQGAYEAYHEALTERQNEATAQPISDDEIVKVMGDQFYADMQGADPKKRQELRSAAEAQIRSKKLSSSLTMKDMHRAKKAEIAEMIVEVDGMEVLNDIPLWLSSLHRSDYQLLEDYVSEKDEESQTEKKS